MVMNLSQMLKTLYHRLGSGAASPVAQAEASGYPGSLQAEVDGALAELHAARAYFDSVSDPELVDHAIYNLEAAQRKYMYLLKQVQRRGAAAGGC